MKKRILLSTLSISLLLAGCGGTSGLLDSSYAGKTYSGTFTLTGFDAQVTTGTITFSTRELSGSWTDAGTTRSISGISNGAYLTIYLGFAIGFGTYSDTTTVNGAGHVVGTLHSMDNSSAVAIDLSPTP